MCPPPARLICLPAAAALAVLLGVLLASGLAPGEAHAQAGPRTAGADVCVVREGWTVVVRPEEGRDALALLLPHRQVSICDDESAAADCRVWLRTSSAVTTTVTVSCGRGRGHRDEVPIAS